MKKVMIYGDLGWDSNGVTIFDVSSKELMDKAYKWIFKNSDLQSYMMEEIQESEAGTPEKSKCEFCNKTGKLKIEGKDRHITCIECNGYSPDKATKIGWKKWAKDIDNFEKAQGGDPKAIKKFINKYASHFGEEDWEIKKVKEIK